MAHELAKKSDGSASFVSVREIPWHGLGVVVDKRMNAKECIKHAGLDYKVSKTNVFAKINGHYVAIPSANATYRNDTKDIFGIVGNRYTIVDNTDAFKFFDAIVGKKEAIYETAGALFGGARVFITAKLPKNIVIGKDVIDQYLLLTSTHDGSGAIKAAFTPIRVVCNNTLQAALKRSTKMVSIRHTTNAVEMLKQAHKLMQITALESDFMDKALSYMVKYPITDGQLKSYIQATLHPRREQIVQKQFDEEFSTRFDNIVDDVLQYAHSHPTQLTKETKGTLYGAYNAISGYYSNVKDFGNAEKRMQQIMYGQVQRKVANAMGIALAVMTNKFQLQ